MTSRELMQQWVEALRGSKYKQGFSYLRYRDGGLVRNCSLGVGAEILVRNRMATWVRFGEESKIVVEGVTGTFYVLPDTAEKLLGIRNWHQSVLIDMNDDGRVPFPRQARWLEDEFLTDRRPK